MLNRIVRIAATLTAAVVTMFLSFVTANAQCPTTPVVSGLKRPSKVIATSKGNLIVAEGGDAVNAGRVSIVDPSGTRRTLVDGLPAGMAVDGGIIGPSGLAMRGRKLYVTIGTGNSVIGGGGPGLESPNPNVSSPIFSSVLEIKFSASVEKKTTGFTLTPADHETLASGAALKLKNRGADKISIRLMANFDNFVPNPRPDAPDNVRSSNPYAVAVLGRALYVADASLNRITRIDLGSGEVTTLVEYGQVPNTLPFGPPIVDSVPDNVRVDGDSLVVSHLTGFPFGPAAAFVDRVDPATGASTPLVSGLTTAIDAMPDAGAVYVLEFSTNLTGTPPGSGRLLRYDDPAGEPAVIVDCLVTPTSLARDPKTGTLYVAQIATGQIVRVDAP